MGGGTHEFITDAACLVESSSSGNRWETLFPLSLCSHPITRFVACPSQKSPPPGKDLHTRKSFPIRSEMTLDLFVPRLDHAEAKMIFLTRIAKISSSSSFRKILFSNSFFCAVDPVDRKKKKEGEEKKNWIRFFDHIFVEKYNMSTTFSCTGGFTRKLVFRRIIRKMRRKLQNWSSKYGNWGRDKSSERDICRGSTKYRDLRLRREGRGGS